MTVVAIGSCHRSAPLEVLEQLSFNADDLPKALAELASSPSISEVVVLSTCSRTEVYLWAERFHESFEDVCKALEVLTGIQQETFAQHLYVHYDDEAVDHLFAVASGLDSVVLGEHEILGQVRMAWDASRREGTSGPLLNLLFRRAVECGKRVRTETSIGRRTASLSQAAVELLAEQLGDLDGHQVLLVGAGEVGSGVASALARSANVSLTVTSRTASRAESVAKGLQARMVPFGSLSSELADHDVVIAATGASGTVISADSLQRALASGAGPKIVLDLAVPRDVESDVADLDGVNLLVLVDLQEFANRGLEARKQAAVEARPLVTEELLRYAEAKSAQEVSPLVAAMRLQAEAVRLSELDRHAARLVDLSQEQVEAVEALSKALVAKMLHEPTVKLKDAAGSRRGERLAQSVRELFDIS